MNYNSQLIILNDEIKKKKKIKATMLTCDMDNETMITPWKNK